MTRESWREVCAWLGIDVPVWKHGAMDYLESRGYRFCLDFGYGNAIEKAREDWISRKKKSLEIADFARENSENARE